MGQFSAFLKKNKIEKKNEKFAVTKSIVDADGKPVEWEFRHLKVAEVEKIRNACTKDVPVKGKPGAYRPKLNYDEYICGMIVASCVMPDLNDAELQDSYDVMGADNLLKEMVDDAGESDNLKLFVQKLNGYDIREEVQEAKN